MSTTPGPWRASRLELSDRAPFYVLTAGDGHCFRGNGFKLAGFVLPEDAILIASLPDLLTAVMTGLRMREAHRAYIREQTLPLMIEAGILEMEFDHQVAELGQKLATATW